MLRRLTVATAVLIAVVAAGAWAAAGTGRRAWAEGAGAGARVEIRDYAFNPPLLTVPEGTTVEWTNYDTAPHTVTGTSGPEPFSSPQLSQGQSWSFTFTVPGSYGYYCAVHPTMTASVVVDRAPAPAPAPSGRAAAPAAGSAAAPSASPSAAPAPAAARAAPPGTVSATPSTAPAAPITASAAAPPTGARTTGPRPGPSSRTLVVLAGVVMVVAVAGSLMVGGRTR